MADYYPALARAVSSLPDNNAQARKELYEHAQTILVEQLRRQDPQKSAQEIMRERAALEMAIRKVEARSRSARTHTPNSPTLPRLIVVVEHDSNDRRGAKSPIGVREHCKDKLPAATARCDDLP
jgi:hypothetical protein